LETWLNEELSLEQIIALHSLVLLGEIVTSWLGFLLLGSFLLGIVCGCSGSSLWDRFDHSSFCNLQ
jgi:hypothetical protein